MSLPFFSFSRSLYPQPLPPYFIFLFLDEVDDLYEKFYFTKALDRISRHLHWANSLVQSHEPWKLSKSTDPHDLSHLNLVLHVAMETLRVCGILLQPIIPHLSDRFVVDVFVVVLYCQDTYKNIVSDFVELLFKTKECTTIFNAYTCFLYSFLLL